MNSNREALLAALAALAAPLPIEVLQQLVVDLACGASAARPEPRRDAPAAAPRVLPKTSGGAKARRVPIPEDLAAAIARVPKTSLGAALGCSHQAVWSRIRSGSATPECQAQIRRALAGMGVEVEFQQPAPRDSRSSYYGLIDEADLDRV